MGGREPKIEPLLAPFQDAHEQECRIMSGAVLETRHSNVGRGNPKRHLNHWAKCQPPLFVLEWKQQERVESSWRTPHVWE